METNIFDIETKPYEAESILQNAKPFDPKSVKLGNLKDKYKIEEKIQLAEEAYKTNLIEKAALDPHASTIVAIGINLANSKEVLHLSNDTEKEILEQFWKLFMHSSEDWAFWSGSNTKECFDPRHIIVRSWVTGTSVPYGIVRKGGWLSDRFLDLTPVYLFGSAYPSYCSVETAVRQLCLVGRESGCGVVSTKESLKRLGVEGKNFHEVLKSDPKLAYKYLTNDVAMERAIAERIL